MIDPRRRCAVALGATSRPTVGRLRLPLCADQSVFVKRHGAKNTVSARAHARYRLCKPTPLGACGVRGHAQHAPVLRSNRCSSVAHLQPIQCFHIAATAWTSAAIMCAIHGVRVLTHIKVGRLLRAVPGESRLLLPRQRGCMRCGRLSPYPQSSTLGLAVEFASNCAGSRNITLHWLHPLKGATYTPAKNIAALLVGYSERARSCQTTMTK